MAHQKGHKGYTPSKTVAPYTTRAGYPKAKAWQKAFNATLGSTDRAQQKTWSGFSTADQAGLTSLGVTAPRSMGPPGGAGSEATAFTMAMDSQTGQEQASGLDFTAWPAVGQAQAQAAPVQEAQGEQAAQAGTQEESGGYYEDTEAARQFGRKSSKELQDERKKKKKKD